MTEDTIKMTHDEMIDVLKELVFGTFDRTTAKEREALDMAIQTLEQEQKTGHWINHGEHCKNLGVMPSGLGAYKWCSNCDCGIDVREWHRNNYNYCPNCGVKMIKSSKREE